MHQVAEGGRLKFDGRARVTIQQVEPEIDAGAYPIKRVVGEDVTVMANVFADGHDLITAHLLYRQEGAEEFIAVPMRPLGNDRWSATFTVTEELPYEYTLEAFPDRFGTWQADLQKKVRAEQDVAVELQIGAAIVREASERARGEAKKSLASLAKTIDQADSSDRATATALSDTLSDLMALYPDRRFATRYDKLLRVAVERERAAFSAWYELFPRSFGEKPDAPGTFKSAAKQIPRIAKMGFDVIYLPPIHPIGTTNRKGRNNATKAKKGDPGSPWAIGAKAGGHKAVHPELGTLKDFEQFVRTANKHEMEVALDIAFQCSPDHPYIKEHPEWFLWRPDGSIQYAENPPKKYEDVVPFNFETDDWEAMWEELKSVFTFWAERGVRIFRVDNPHTKPFPFWEWTISEVKKEFPDVIFLAEAFTRPRVMERLARIGFHQSYTYFTWRNSKGELTEYVRHLTRTRVREYFRPNFWPNTPDILPEYLQYGGRPAFLIRACLAATLSSNYGMYGPAFELCEAAAVPGKEEYLNSEKYELKNWDLKKPGRITEMITILNHIRRENAALHRTNNIQFFEVDNEAILCYGKLSDDGANMILVVVNLDPFHKQSGFVRLPLRDLEIETDRTYMMHELVGDDRFIWQGERNYIELDPHVLPFQIFRVHRRMRRESDFDYYM